jgi:hypothetical protein
MFSPDAGVRQLVSGLGNPNKLALDATHVYWTEETAVAGQNCVARVPLDGGTRESLACFATTSGSSGLAVDDVAVYFLHTGTQGLYLLAK